MRHPTSEPPADDDLVDTEHLATADFWRAPAEHRHRVFAALRGRPVRWFEPVTSDFVRPSTGFWALTRYDDVWQASRNAAVFRSGLGIDIEETPDELQDYISSMITMDDPQHHRLRRIVSAGFTPRHVAALDAQLRATATEIVDDVLDRYGDGTVFDAVEAISARLPLRAIGDMMGVPSPDQPQLFAWTNVIVTPDEPAHGVEGAAAANRAMTDYATALGEARLASPTDDLTSVLMHAEVDGERLSTREFANFFILLITAGNETTRNAISHGLRLLTLHPEQRRIWFDDFAAHAPTAVDEIVRYETPITHMCRILADDVTFGDVPIAAGDKVAMWYTSANRDDTVFEGADRFDVRRPLHPQQVGFGAGGPHFCLGANLARREVAVMFDEIRRRLPEIAVVAEPERALSMSLNSITRLPVTISP